MKVICVDHLPRFICKDDSEVYLATLALVRERDSLGSKFPFGIITYEVPNFEVKVPGGPKKERVA